MKNKTLSNLFALIPIIFGFVGGMAAQTVDSKKKSTTADGKYEITQSLRLKKSVNGLDGKLEILTDVRLTADVYVTQTKGYPPEIENSDEKTKELFRSVPIRMAILRTVDERGKEIDSKMLESFSAELKRVRLYSTAKPSYQITCQYGSVAPYLGEESVFANVVKGKLQWLEAVDKKTGKNVPMAFVDADRDSWDLSRALSGQSTDILHVATGWDDNEQGGDFMVVYERFHFDGKRWIRYQRKVKNYYWESDFHFPEIAKFPKVL